MRTVYQFKPWSRLKGDAQAVGEAIEKIIETRGAAGPRDLVEGAREPASVLHSYFSWDDSEAAEKYRETQASHLLRSIIATRSDGIDIKAPVRGFVPISAATEDAADGNNEPRGRYIAISSAMSVVAYREQLMRDAMRDLDAYRLRYQLLSDLSGWSSALDKAKTVLERSIRAVEQAAA